MTEIRTRLIPVRVEKACKCVVGRMRHTGQSLLVQPPQHGHECNSCGARETFTRTYPYIDYEVDTRNTE